MGGNVLHYFMKWVESDQHGNIDKSWVNTHIEAVASIASPWLGVPKTVPSFISGEMRDTAQLGWFMSSILERVFTRQERAGLFRNWGGVASMIPKGGN